MSYQIKSTPFFRRMLTTSKQNGQLQKLKEEYERMRDFDDRTIEVKMRQVRLKRLFKEIEEIKEMTAQSHHMKRRRMSERNKTLEDLRLETLVRAKELGKEYSKVNGLFGPKMVRSERSAVSVNGTGSVPKLQARASDIDRKQMLAKAISYGNQTSRANLVKITSLSGGRKKTPEVEQLLALKMANQAKLQQRLQYGNSCSHKNIAKRRTRNATAEQTAEPETPDNADPNNEEDLRLMPRVTTFKTFEQLQASKIRITSESQANGEEDAHVRAQRFWHKVALTVRHRFDTLRRPAPPLDQSDDLDDDMEYRLRTISNETDLTALGDKTRPEIRRFDQTLIVIPDSTLMGGEDAITNEVLQRVEQLNGATTTTTNRHSILDSNQIDDDVYLDADEGDTTDYASDSNTNNNNPDVDPSALVVEAKRLITPSEKVQKLAKIFEPFVRAAAQKEAFDGVQKLKSIFEHQTD